MNKAVIVFSGYNQRAVIAFIRTLEKLNCEYGIIASSKNDPIFLTNYKNRVYATRKLTELDIQDVQSALQTVKTKMDVKTCLIAPSTEALNRFLLDNIKLLDISGCEVPLVSKKLYETISDKYSFGKLCEQYGILTPREYKSLEEAKIPFVAKPKKYISTGKLNHSPVIIQTPRDLKEFKVKYSVLDFFFQDYVDGESLYLLYYFYKNGKVTRFSQKNVVQQPGGKSILAAESSVVHESKEALEYEKLLKSIGFTGLIMIEIKRLNNKCYMIEANPRFWGPSQLFVDIGVNLFEDLLFDNEITDGLTYDIHDAQYARYFWGGGVMSSIKNNGQLSFHDYSKDKFERDYDDWRAYDLYDREDTIKIYEKESIMTTKEILIEKYSQNSKHSNYQLLPTKVRKVIGQHEVKTKTRYEEVRLEYLLNKLDVKDKSILDIGGNTGYFTFELIDHGAADVVHYEGNKEHSEFVNIAADVIGYNERVRVVNKYFPFDGSYKNFHDVVLLFNVLHHVGDDYSKKILTITDAKKEIITQLNSLQKNCAIMVFQLGFNWRGDPTKPLFTNGTKKEMIEYVKEGIKGVWDIVSIGIAKKEDVYIFYEEQTDKNVERDDSLGEFLNRPIFILKPRN